MADVSVLVVDDDFMVARIHTQFVERTPGFVVVGVASTGQAALDDIARLRPDLVLLDVHLPDMTGIDVLRRLRAECADVVGISRVSARRYLEHFVARGAASVRLQYGGAGRPERRYRSGS
jgi:response regulator of citrate/malate metabolism